MSSFQVVWSDVHVAVALRPLPRDIANHMIDVLDLFACPLHDPQLGSWWPDRHQRKRCHILRGQRP
jgi:hypothetical protein